MEAETSIPASNLARARSPESLRQRQRDRLSPRGRFTKTSRISTTIREIEGLSKYGVKLQAAPRPKETRKHSPDIFKQKQLQDGLRMGNSVNRRAQREAEDMKSEVAPDGGSGGREGRQFTVAKVGNNGKIYLR
jgi:hypothetical protein